ncbi:hypothetical protein [Thermoanaerobacter uzonensis]
MIIAFASKNHLGLNSDNADIENELLLNDIEVIKNVNGRIADILKEL